jgi:hypothetical protein
VSLLAASIVCKHPTNKPCSYAVPLVHMIVTFAYFTIVQKKELSASVVFSALGGFDVLRWGMFNIIGTLPALIQAHVSIGRFQEFLNDVCVCAVRSG